MQGLLTGKYTAETAPGGPRKGAFKAERLQEIEPLLGLMRDIGSAHGGKTPSQVATVPSIALHALGLPWQDTIRSLAPLCIVLPCPLCPFVGPECFLHRR